MRHQGDLTLEHLVAARDALESWVDAFSDDEEHDAEVERVREVVVEFNRLIALMQAPDGPQLRLVKPKPEDLN